MPDRTTALSKGFGQLSVMRDRDVLTLAAWFGLLGGLAEAAHWIIGYFILHRTLSAQASWDMLWTIPLSAVTALLVIGLILVVMSRLWRAAAPLVRGAALPVFCFLTIYFGRIVAPGIHPIALVVLAAGISVALTRLAAQRTAAFLRFARRSTLVAAALLCLVAVALGASQRAAFKGSYRGRAAAAPGSPNIILIIWDTVRAASMSLYGYARATTPNLDKLAADAVVFDRAISPAPWTLPAHASLFTGLYHHQHSADRDSPLDTSAPTLAEILRGNGYHTAGFIANTWFVGSGFGLDRGFDWYDDKPPLRLSSVLLSWSGVQTVLAPILKRRDWQQRTRITAGQVNESFLQWIDARDSQRPFFAFLNQFDAHQPYRPPAPFKFVFSDDVPLHHWDHLSERKYSEAQLADLRAAYDACIYYLDQQLENLLGELEKRGLLANTLIVLTSDHGETLGEQSPRLIGHSNNIYHNVLHVPLVFYWPSQLAGGTRIETVVNLVDVAATLVDATGAASRAQAALPGATLWPLTKGTTANQPAARPALSQVNPADFQRRSTVWPVAKGPLYSLVTSGGLHYIVNREGEEQIFDIAADPWENESVVHTPDGRRSAAESRRIVASMLRERGPGDLRQTHRVGAGAALAH